MKRIILILLSLMCIFPSPVSASEEITVYLDGQKLSFEQPPIIQNDSVLVPFRAIFVELNMSVEWEFGARKRVTATDVHNGTEITLYIDEDTMYVDGEAYTLNTPPVIYNDFTLIPLRAVSEAAGAEVGWDGQTRTVYIDTGAGDFDTWAKTVLELTNKEREKEGLTALKWSETLSLLAEVHCEDMIERNFFDHINPDGEGPFDRMNKYDIAYWTAGENIAVGQKSPKEVVEDWMASPTHRENILNPKFRSLGVSVIRGGSYGIYWVQEFAWLK